MRQYILLNYSIPPKLAVRSARSARDLTQSECAQLVGVTTGMWRMYETGKRKMSGAKWHHFQMLLRLLFPAEDYAVSGSPRIVSAEEYGAMMSARARDAESTIAVDQNSKDVEEMRKIWWGDAEASTQVE